MKFTPKTETEIQSENLWPAGEYGFEILAATAEVSKAGNDMIKLKVAVFNGDGQQRIIFDYLMESVAYKLRHVCEVCGLLAKYDAGSILPDDFVSKTGKLKLSVKKDKTGQYADQNSVADYLTEKHGGTSAEQPKAKNGAAVSSIQDDSIPFMAHQPFIWA